MEAFVPPFLRCDNGLATDRGTTAALPTAASPGGAVVEDASQCPANSALSSSVTVFSSEQVDVDFDEEIGQGVHGVVYEGRLRPSDRLVAVKVLHAHYRFEEVMELAQNLSTSLDQYFPRTNESTRAARDRIVEPLGLYRLPYGQKQTCLVLPRAPTTLEKELKKIHRAPSIVPMLRHVCAIGEIVELLAELYPEYPPRDKLFNHREIKPCDVLLFPSGNSESSGDGALASRWMPMIPLRSRAAIVETTRYTDPAMSANFVADADADVFSVSVMLWEVVERRDAVSAFGELPFPLNPLVPRDLRQCISLGVSGRRDKRCSIRALCTELRYSIRAMYQREIEDKDYRERKIQQDALKRQVYDIMEEAVRNVRDIYASASTLGIGYAVECEAAAQEGHLRLAVGTGAESIDVQYRRGDYITRNSFEFEPPLKVYESTIEHVDPSHKQSVAFNEVVDSVETVDLSDGVPKRNVPAVRISNYRQLAYTPTLEYEDAAVEGFLCECKHIQFIDLSALRTHVRKIGDFFLFNCVNLVKIVLDPFEDVTVVGFAFLAGCRSLTALDLKPLSKVQSVGGNFLHNCISLEEINLAPLVNAADIGPHTKMMFGCLRLRRVRIPRNMTIDMIDVHPGKWVEENDKWWEWTNGERVYFIPRLEPTE